MDSQKSSQKIEILDKVNLSQLHWIHWLVVVGSLVLTISAWYFSKEQLSQRQQAQFSHQAQQIMQLLQERMTHYEDGLRSGVSMIQTSSEEVSHEQWKRFSQTLSIETRYPGINGIGVIHYVGPKELDGYLSWQRKLRPNYKIHPQHSQNEYWPISYIEPVDINQKAVGLDMAHEENRYNAAKNARDTGSPQMTAPIVLVQDAKKTPGFLLFLPFYQSPTTLASVKERQDSFKGLVYAPFILENLMDGVLENNNRLVNFSIADQGEVIYDELTRDSKDFDPMPMFTTQKSIDLYGRKWLFNIQSSTLFRAQSSSNQPYFILVGGVLIDTLLLALFITLSRSNVRSQLKVDKVTKDLISHQKNLEAAHKKLSAAMDSMIDSLLILDTNGDILECNMVAETAFGYSKQTLLNMNISDLFTEPDRIKELLHSEVRFSRINDSRAKTRDGNYFPAETTVMKMGKVEGFQVGAYTSLIRDVSQQKAAEIAKAQFVSTVSHELRTPLTSIKGGLGLVIGLEKEHMQDSSFEMLQVAYRNAERLHKLVEDLLNIDQIDTGSMSFDFSKIDLVDILTTSISDCQQLASEAGLIVHTDYETQPAFVYADEYRLSQVIINILSNAYNYSPKQGNVEIRLITHGDYYRVTVKDEGKGIPNSFRDKVFARFSQVDSSDTREKGGTGLGLSISKAIVERHGGIISFKSKLNEGTTFIIDLPRGKMDGN